MSLPYKFGHVLTSIWLVWIAYGYAAYDGITDETRLAQTVFLTFAGLIVFPIYFLIVFACCKLPSNRQ